jgi:hypothetical protein
VNRQDTRVDLRLVALALGAPVAMLAAGRHEAFAPMVALLVPAAALAWAFRTRTWAWALALLPGAVVAELVAGGVLGYAAVVLAGPIAASLARRGRPVAEALLWGVAPVAMHALVAALSGVELFPEASRKALEEVLAQKAQGRELSPEAWEQLRATSAIVIDTIVRLRVVWEVAWFWFTLVLAYVLLQRLFRDDLPALGRFSSFDVSDAFLWALIVGLVLVLSGTSFAPPWCASAGWNLTALAGVAFLLRGLAVGGCILQRAGVSRVLRVAALVGGALLFLPAFAATATGVGLMDAWFDFRRIRPGAERTNPFTLFGRSTVDDLHKEE